MPGPRTGTRYTQGSKTGLFIFTSAAQGDPPQRRDAWDVVEGGQEEEHLKPGDYRVVFHSKACGRVARSVLDVKKPQARISQVIESLEFGRTQNGEGRVGGKEAREGPTAVILA